MAATARFDSKGSLRLAPWHRLLVVIIIVVTSCTAVWLGAGVRAALEQRPVAPTPLLETHAIRPVKGRFA